MAKIGHRFINFLFISIVLFSLPAIAFSEWRIETFQDPQEFRDFDSGELAIDSRDNPHIAYGSGKIYYATHDGTSWMIQTVDNSGGAYRPSLALDNLGKPHLSYLVRNHDADYVKYAFHDGTSWQIETVDSIPSYIDDPLGKNSIALDSQGRPHISYGSSTGLNYASYDGVSWGIETVDSSGRVYSTSLKLDSQGRPHISYSVSGTGLNYASNDGVSWQIETVDSEVLRSTSLALDSQGRPHISYGSSTGLNYASYDGVSWGIETVDSSGSVYRTSLELDSQGRPHISYSVSGTDLNYASYDGISWVIEALGISGSSPSIVLGSADKPHISYFNYGNHTLNYAVHDGTAWQFEIVDRAGKAGIYGSLALDTLGRPHISYGDLINYDIKYASYDDTSWQFENVDSTLTYSMRKTSLELDSVGSPHIIYRGNYDQTNRSTDLKYTFHDGTSWQIGTIVKCQLYDYGESSFALDKWDRPHVIYRSNYVDKLVSYDLNYAFHDGALWQIETVEKIAGPYNKIALALDALGRPHISYLDRNDDSAYDLKYALHDGSSWHTEIVEKNGGNYWSGSSLAIDITGRPHISYIYKKEYGIYHLNYAFHDGTSWRIETADSKIGFSSNTSLALDTLGRPHISYSVYGAGNTVDGAGLNYAFYDGASWQIETVVSGRTHIDSLALDASDRAHISYSGNKYATNAPLVTDTDRDGIPDEGDGSGDRSDNPCAGGETQNCDDNCRGTSNPDQGDMDGDGVGDLCDNCREVYNSDQRDSNAGEDDNSLLDGEQHYGDVCDIDLNNDGIVNKTDFTEWRQYFGQSVPPAPEYTDCDGSGFVGLGDFNLLRTSYGHPPGPGIGD